MDFGLDRFFVAVLRVVAGMGLNLVVPPCGLRSGFRQRGVPLRGGYLAAYATRKRTYPKGRPKAKALGYQPRILGDFERPKAEALGYPEANRIFVGHQRNPCPRSGTGGIRFYWVYWFCQVWLVFIRMGDAMRLSTPRLIVGGAMPLEHWRGLKRIE
jgi:hypothetical protein